MKKYWAEFLGTYILVFVGCGAIIINNISGAILSVFACKLIQKEDCCTNC